MKTVKRIARLLSPKRSGSKEPKEKPSPSQDGRVSTPTQPSRPAQDGVRADVDAFHAKLAPIKCTPASLEADDGEEPVLLRASYYHSLPSSQRPAFSTYQQHAPEYMAESAAEASPPHTPGKLPSTDAVKDPEDVKQPNNSMAAASPAARTPPQAPRVRALKRLMQTKNRPPSPMPSPGELARGAVRPALAPLQHKSCGLLSAQASDGKGLAKGNTASTRRTSRFAAASAAGSENAASLVP